MDVTTVIAVALFVLWAVGYIAYRFQKGQNTTMLNSELRERRKRH